MPRAAAASRPRCRSPSPSPEPRCPVRARRLAFRPAPVRAGGPPRGAANPRLMHNRALHDALAAFVEDAARQLADEVSGGAEIPFELIEQGRASAPAVLLPAAHRAASSASGSARSRGCRPTRPPSRGSAALPDLPAYLVAARAPHARARQPLAGRRRAAGVPHRRLGGGDRVRLRPPALRRRLHRARVDRLRRLHAVGGARAGRRPRDRVRRAGARRRARAGARRHAAATRPATWRPTSWPPSRCSRSRARPATTARSRAPGAACAGCRPRCGCGTTPSPRSARPPGRAPTAARGGPSRWPPASGARRATACSRPRRRTPCARSARSSRAARRAAASWRGRCGASSSAASARARSRR